VLLSLQTIGNTFYGAQGIEECVARVDGVASRQEGDTYGFFWGGHGEGQGAGTWMLCKDLFQPGGQGRIDLCDR